MDTDVLKSTTDCKAIGKKPCQWWYEPLGECKRPSNIDCPEGVRRPQQEFTEQEYLSLG